MKVKSILMLSIFLCIFVSTGFGNYLYALQTDGGFYRIDPADGSYEAVTSNSVSGVVGLAYNTVDHYLYALQTGNGFYRIDPADGSYEAVTSNSLSGVVGLAYVPEPTTLLLLGLGFLLMKSKRQKRIIIIRKCR